MKNEMVAINPISKARGGDNPSGSCLSRINTDPGSCNELDSLSNLVIYTLLKLLYRIQDVRLRTFPACFIRNHHDYDNLS